MGFEPTASTMRMWRAPSCANAPYCTLYHRFSEKESKNFQCLKYKVIAGREIVSPVLYYCYGQTRTRKVCVAIQKTDCLMDSGSCYGGIEKGAVGFGRGKRVWEDTKKSGSMGGNNLWQLDPGRRSAGGPNISGVRIS